MRYRLLSLVAVSGAATMGTSIGRATRTPSGGLVCISCSSRFGEDPDERPAPNPMYSYAYYQKGAQNAGSGGLGQQGGVPHRRGPGAPTSNVNLLKQVSSVSIGMLFALLIWRSLSAYELADQFASGTLRLLAVTPTVAILCLNLAGFVVNMLRPINFKNHLKVILVANICREVAELVYNMMMIIVSSSSSPIPREVYFGRFMMSSWWLFLCLSFAKGRWVSTAAYEAGQTYQQQQQQQQHNQHQQQQGQEQQYNQQQRNQQRPF